VLTPVTRFVAIGFYHLLVMGVLVPLMAIRGRRRVIPPDAPLPNRTRHFRTTAAILVLFGLLSLLTARVQRIDLFSADARSVLLALPAGVAMYAAAVWFMRPRWRRAVERRTRVVYPFMPETSTERAWWVTVSLLAGVLEEITWRGVQTFLLVALVGAPAAVVVCAAMFGLAHMVQGWKSSAIISVFALGFHGLVWLSGSLYVAMAVHAIYDVTAGIQYGRLGRELGYDIGRPAAADSGPVPL
jgi:membrane protease YdiL (CAAX protease family)